MRIESHFVDSVSGNREKLISAAKLKMIHQLDVTIVEDDIGFSQKSNDCSYLSPSVDLGPKRLKIRGPSFPSTISEVEISYRLQEDSDLARHHTQ
jgi:histone demethylase JARID1